MVHEKVVRPAGNMETGEEEIEVLDAGELAVERFSKRPTRNRTVQSGNVTVTTAGRGRVPRSVGSFSTRSFGAGGRPRAISAVAAPSPHRARYFVPPLCQWSSRLRNTP